jgi:hypothetical protein
LIFVRNSINEKVNETKRNENKMMIQTWVENDLNNDSNPYWSVLGIMIPLDKMLYFSLITNVDTSATKCLPSVISNGPIAISTSLEKYKLFLYNLNKDLTHISLQHSNHSCEFKWFRWDVSHTPCISRIINDWVTWIC